MNYKERALSAVELLEKWSGDTELPFSQFRKIHTDAVELNARIVRGELVVLTKAEHDDLIANQKKRK